jgi:hypothetical protein
MQGQLLVVNVVCIRLVSEEQKVRPFLCTFYEFRPVNNGLYSTSI